MPPKRKDSDVTRRKAPARGCLLLDLEGAALGGRKIVYDLLSSMLADRDAKLSPRLFAKHCIDAEPAVYLSPMLQELGKSRLSPEKFLQNLNDGYRLSLLDGNTMPCPGFVEFMEAVQAKLPSVGLVTALDRETAASICDKIGLDATSTPMVTNCRPWDITPSSNPWNQLARKLDSESNTCIAVTTSPGACRAAIASTLWCVVWADTFVASRDFTGADFVFDELNADAAACVLATVGVA